MRGGLVGIVVNPLSGRDIRRLVAHASVFPNAEKANMVQRLLLALRATGIERAMVSTDLGGVSAAVARAVRSRRRRIEWPEVVFVDDDPITQTAADTANAVRRMAAAGAGAIVCLGGDGTARVAAAALGDVPLVALSTGTNNVFPELREATVAGVAAGLVASGAVPADEGTYRASLLEVTVGRRRDHALVDVAVTTSGHTAARAVWDPAVLRELYCTFAEPDAIGLSSIAGLLCPCPRTDPSGIALQLTDPDRAAHAVLAPIAPGLLIEVGVDSWSPLRPGAEVAVGLGHGVIALDGEREIEFTATRPTVRLVPRGPRCVDIPRVLALATARGLLTRAARSGHPGVPSGDACARHHALPA
jgi:predicted polyphosphate/ATP-dependent NAD kinase